MSLTPDRFTKNLSSEEYSHSLQSKYLAD